MNRTKRLTGACSECGGSIEFPAELVGTLTTCPRCRKQTELMLAAPPEEPLVPRRVVIWTVVAVVILVLGLIMTVVGLNHYAKLAARQRDHSAAAAGAKDAAAAAGFEVSAISLEKEQGSNEIYAVGTVVNTSDRPRSQVALELDLFDAEGQKVGIARTYRPMIAPGAKWELKVPVARDIQAVFAKLASIKEGQ